MIRPPFIKEHFLHLHYTLNKSRSVNQKQLIEQICFLERNQADLKCQFDKSNLPDFSWFAVHFIYALAGWKNNSALYLTRSSNFYFTVILGDTSLATVNILQMPKNLKRLALHIFPNL